MRKGEQTRRMVIEKASSLFNQKGYTSSFISDVMRETGLKKGGIYRHFESKEELAYEAFQFLVDAVSEHYSKALEGKTNAKERLLAFINAFQVLEKDEPIPGGCPLMNAANEFDDTTSTLIPHVQDEMSNLLAFVESEIIKGQENNEINKDTNTRQASIIIISTLEGALSLSRLFKNPEPMNNAVEYLHSYVQLL